MTNKLDYIITTDGKRHYYGPEGLPGEQWSIDHDINEILVWQPEGDSKTARAYTCFPMVNVVMYHHRYDPQGA